MRRMKSLIVSFFNRIFVVSYFIDKYKVIFAFEKKLVPQTYQRVRAGRQMRSRSKRRRTAGGGTDGGDGDGEEWQTCPVCDAHVDADTADDMRAHIERCLRKVGGRRERERKWKEKV